MRSNRRLRVILVALALLSQTPPGLAVGQQTYVYPQRGQSPDQQARDQSACHTWAVQQTGYDPMRAQAARTPWEMTGRFLGASSSRSARVSMSWRTCSGPGQQGLELAQLPPQARVGAAGRSPDELIADRTIDGSPAEPLAGLLPLCYQHIPNHADPSAAWLSPES